MWVAYKADLWVYPVLKVMQTHQRVVFIAVLLLLFVIIYLLGEALTKWLWGEWIMLTALIVVVTPKVVVIMVVRLLMVMVAVMAEVKVMTMMLMVL